MVYIREDLAPLMLEWKPIDEQEEDRAISIPLNSLTTLQSTKETSPKMILKIVYKLTSGPPNTNADGTDNGGGGGEEKSFKLTFTNRPTMNTIKDSLQTIVARSRTRLKVPVLQLQLQLQLQHLGQHHKLILPEIRHHHQHQYHLQHLELLLVHHYYH